MHIALTELFGRLCAIGLSAIILNMIKSIIIAGLACCVVGNLAPRRALAQGQPQQKVGLRNLAISRGVRLGTAAPIDLLRRDADNGAYRAFLLSEFNMIEPENDFKPPAIWQGEGKYNLDKTDWLLGAPGHLGWAQSNGFAVRGHVLVYARDDGYTLPQWLRDQEANITPDKARQLLKDYIYAVAGRYKGKVFAWDVVNEAIDDAPNQRPFQLRNSFWFRKLGRDFVKLAFQFAHEADPWAELYYNEYGAEGLGRKSDAVLELVRWLRAEGVFVSGVGMQWHKGVNDRITPGDDYYKNAERLRKQGFDFQVTELDVAMPVKPFPKTDARHGQEAASPNDLKKQADVYRAVLRYALSFSNCRGFQVWGFTDKHSWIPSFSNGKNGAALISDAKYQPKAAHAMLREELAASSPPPAAPSSAPQIAR